MKRLALSLVFIAGWISSVFALELSLDIYNYYDISQHQAYIDSYIRVLGGTVSFEKVASGQKQAAVHITLTVERETEIIAYDKFTLYSPEVDKIGDFLDMKRYGLTEGVYAVHIIAIDAHDESNKLELKQFIEITERSGISFSDIQLLAKVKNDEHIDNPLVKHGLYMEPVTYSYIADNMKNLDFFVELYDVNEAAYLKYAIIESYGIDNGREVLSKYKKLNIAPTTPLVLSLPVDELISGNYHLLVEVFDKGKNVLTIKRCNFIRSNTTYDKEYWQNFDEIISNSFVDSIADRDLRYNLLSLIPVAKEPYLSSLPMLLDLKNPRAQRKFLLNYWKDQSSQYPQLAHSSYMKVVDLVDDLYYNNVGRGFQSDRGHIFLKYGKPDNVISVDTEPDAVPYEIWYYYSLEEVRQTNVRFLFYNSSLAHNDYHLLHSTCRGERHNPAWEVELYRDAPKSQIGATIEATEVKDGWNRRAKEYFNDF